MRHIIKHIVVILIVAVIETVLITPAVALVYPDVDHMLFFMTVMINSTAFPILLGIPLIIILQEELGLKPKPFRKRKAEAEIHQ